MQFREGFVYVCLLINSFWLIKLHYADIKCYCLATGKTLCVREMSLQVGHTYTHTQTHTSHSPGTGSPSPRGHTHTRINTRTHTLNGAQLLEAIQVFTVRDSAP